MHFRKMVAIVLTFFAGSLSFASADKSNCFKNDLDAPKCTSIGVKFKIYHDDLHNKQIWNEIALRFLNLALLAQQSEKYPDDTRWMEELGDKFKDVRDIIVNGYGLHGNISISNVDDTIQFEAYATHDDSYDEQAWQDVVAILTEAVEKSDHDENANWIAPFFPMVADAVELAGDESGIHGSLDVVCEGGSC